MDRRFGYLAAPLPAVAIGLVVMADLGVGSRTLLLNVGFVVVGAILVAVAGRRRRAASGAPPGRTLAIGLVAVAAIATTCLVAGQDGVHRWISAGSFRVNLSLLLTPVVLVAVARLARAGRAGAVVMLAALQAVHVRQPDAAQATAAAVAAIVIAAVGSDPSATRLRRALAGTAVVGAALSWWRVDPLEGVAHVEGVVDAAFAIGPLVGAGAVLAAVALVVPFVADGLWSRRRAVPLAFGGYVAALLVASQVGEFPVPVLGAGFSTVLGWYGAATGALVAGEPAPDRAGALVRAG